MSTSELSLGRLSSLTPWKVAFEGADSDRSTTDPPSGSTCLVCPASSPRGISPGTGVAPLILYSADERRVLTRVGAGKTPATATLEDFKEHGKNRVTNLESSIDFSGERWTVDEPEDLEVIRRVFQYFSPRRDFNWQEVIERVSSVLKKSNTK